MLDHLELPLRATLHGGNVSPSIKISGLEPEAESIVIMVFNPFIKSCCSFTPWIIWNIPPMSRIPEGIPHGLVVENPVPATQGMNDYGDPGYHGPEPPAGEIHRYQFRVYVLDSMLPLPGGSKKDDLISAMVGHVIQYGETVAISSG
ncbi:MAG: YbhB/YbcL family Raf kinase inhibitor-like protein [Methanomicrobiales archaeon HGW-Methanomicrobiales-4]|nr:MAG: YbhB/YbcL family Raf kinase inhibitor-like protein [Methanomicrobiales archaeon HGW-Methanomicrobiales-4]